MNNGFDERLARVRALMAKRNLESLVIQKNPNLAWFTGGRVHVPTTIDAACLDIVVTLTEVTAITNEIEAPRLIAEELPSEVKVRAIKWWGSRDAELPRGDHVASDADPEIAAALEILRGSLIALDIERLRQISVDAAVSIGAAMRTVHPTDREIDVAGMISKQLWESDLEIVFLGVAGADRVFKFRHPLPTTKLVGNRVLASICAKRKGLIASVTRIVNFGEIEASEIDSYLDLLRVEAAILDATVVGDSFSKPIEAASKAYGAHNFDVLEWHKHHQGGPTGYLPRDWPANLGSTRLIGDHQPIAWNPTGKGWKVEDTFITTENGPELLSFDPSWPAIEVAGRLRPGILQF